MTRSGIIQEQIHSLLINKVRPHANNSFLLNKCQFYLVDIMELELGSDMKEILGRA